MAVFTVCGIRDVQMSGGRDRSVNRAIGMSLTQGRVKIADVCLCTELFSVVADRKPILAWGSYPWCWDRQARRFKKKTVWVLISVAGEQKQGDFCERTATLLFTASHGKFRKLL